MVRRNSKSRSFVKRKFKRTSSRKLSPGDIQVLDFLWTWKVASQQMLILIGYPNASPWWAYKAIKQLEKEKYIQALPRGKYLDQEVWTLTHLGFEVVLMDRDDIVEYRFKPHAPAHDYLATCLQLGQLWTSSWDKVFFTEQMLASLRASNFPKDFVKDEGHVPDGITILRHGLKEIGIGYEVDLNLKDPDRYRKTFDYYNRLENVPVVFWLVRNDWIAGRITQMLKENSYGQRSKSYFAFIRLEDFQKELWDAKVLNGNYQGLSLCKVHENLMQSLGKANATLGQKPIKEIFFSKFKSPQKSTTSQKGEVGEIL
ncbi:MAG: hypothetical protein ACXVB1_12135 [Pseudobdellovibrionaceae bacterium]